MTTVGLIWANRRMYVLLFLAFSVLAALAYSQFGSLGASYLLVSFVAVVVRDIGFYRRSIAIWPILEQIVDWQKAEDLAASDATPNI